MYMNVMRGSNNFSKGRGCPGPTARKHNFLGGGGGGVSPQLILHFAGEGVQLFPGGRVRLFPEGVGGPNANLYENP